MHMDRDEYIHDEALRVTEVTAMYEGNTYRFTVRNSGGTFFVCMVGHTLPGLRGIECRRVSDPVPADRRNLKEAIWESIQKHTALVHQLSIVEKTPHE